MQRERCGAEQLQTNGDSRRRWQDMWRTKGTASCADGRSETSTGEPEISEEANTSAKCADRTTASRRSRTCLQLSKSHNDPNSIINAHEHERARYDTDRSRAAGGHIPFPPPSTLRMFGRAIASATATSARTNQSGTNRGHQTVPRGLSATAQRGTAPISP